MPAHPFQQTLRKRISRIKKQADALSRVCRQKDLHLLRIELKRLRALLRLLRYTDPEFPYFKVYQPFKVLFNRAGQLRFWQIQIKLLENTATAPEPFSNRYRRYSEYRRHLANHLFRETARWGDLPRWRDVKNLFRISLERCNTEALAGYFTYTRESATGIAGRVGRTLPAERHELRKIMKEYTMNRQLVSRHFNFDPGPLPAMPDDPALLDVPFGQWHDLQAAGKQLAEDLRIQPWDTAVLTGGREVLREWKKEERVIWKRVRAVLEGVG